MNISWNDLSNVQEAGDFPFRDGTITVSFVEIAIWKNNSAAQFQLMRKHPIHGAFRYVLGRQVEGKSGLADTEFIYESSNGDSWCLTWDPVKGERAVLHRPNPQSGGQVSYIEIDKFLSQGANGPEHQALRNLTPETDCHLLVAQTRYRPQGEIENRALWRAWRASGVGEMNYRSAAPNQ